MKGQMYSTPKVMKKMYFFSIRAFLRNAEEFGNENTASVRVVV